MLNQDKRAAIFSKHKIEVEQLHSRYLAGIAKYQSGDSVTELAEAFFSTYKDAVERVESELAALRVTEPNQVYDRICDVPDGATIKVPWLVEATSYSYPRLKTFEFELTYGAHPRHWKGFKDTGWSYYRTLMTPEDFDRKFRVI